MDSASQLHSTKPPWPTLKYLMIIASIQSPNGQFYYTGNPAETTQSHNDYNWLETESDTESESGSGYVLEVPALVHEKREKVRNGEEPQHAWRKDPDPEVLNPLMLAMARAVRHMPALRRLSLRMGENLRELRGIVVECLGAGEQLLSPPIRSERVEEASQTHLRRWKVWVGVETRWQPTPDIEALWKEFVGPSGITKVGRFPY